MVFGLVAPRLAAVQGGMRFLMMMATALGVSPCLWSAAIRATTHSSTAQPLMMIGLQENNCTAKIVRSRQRQRQHRVVVAANVVATVDSATLTTTDDDCQHDDVTQDDDGRRRQHRRRPPIHTGICHL